MLIDSPASLSKNTPSLLFAHGAGASMDSDFIRALTDELVTLGVQVLRFNFAYMQTRIEQNSRRPPPKAETLISEMHKQVHSASQQIKGRLFIGGKSMGARVATMLANSQYDSCLSFGVSGVIAFGFPFHAPKKSAGERLVHLKKIKLPTHIIQGTRDAFGSVEEVPGFCLPKIISFHWLEHADHDFKPLKSSGLTQQECIKKAAASAYGFMSRVSGDAL